MISKNSRQVCRTLNTLRVLQQHPVISTRHCLLDKCQETLVARLPLLYGTQCFWFSNAQRLRTDSKAMYEGEASRNLNVGYEEVVKAQSDPETVIIDVREQNEIDETGKLPESVHIPMGDVARALTDLSQEEFKRKFQRNKPAKNTRIILSCRSGKRSAMVQEEIQKLGYTNAYNYTGGWMDWESRQKV